MDADAVEIRTLGCLIEKQHTTPGAYPLSLNSLRLACNQATNRDPVVEYDEATIRAALERLSRKGWVRLASGAGSRAAKYRQLFGDALGISGAELSVLAVLMLRGPQTTGELKQRTERLHPFPSLEEVEGVLGDWSGGTSWCTWIACPGRRRRAMPSSSAARTRVPNPAHLQR
jgi:uncharacterized protein YceH (UPF0502 family)